MLNLIDSYRDRTSPRVNVHPLTVLRNAAHAILSNSSSTSPLRLSPNPVDLPQNLTAMTSRDASTRSTPVARSGDDARGKILLCGLCPLPFENTRRSFGPGIRTWQFAHSLLQAGHRVHLLAMRIPGTYEGCEPVAREEREGLVIERLTQEEFFDPARLEKTVREVDPDILVGATLYGSHILALTATDLPLWADQFGHVMAEAQAKAHLERANWPLAHFWRLLEPVLRRADRLSVVSEPQRYAAIGELGLVGRLTWENCGVELIETIPCALVPRPAAETRTMLRGTAYPDKTFVVFWSGGYNVWSDVDTLFSALELAMEREDSIHFVSTGGEIGGHDETTYRRFGEAIATSRFAHRFHLQGWVEADDVPSYEDEADLGVLSEIPMYEGMLGSKNRIVQWMGHGLPSLYNRVGDLGRLLETEKLGLTFEVGDAGAMAEAMVWAAHHRDELAAMAERARRHTLRQLSFEATTRSLVAWAARPRRAPDAPLHGTVQSPADFAPAPPAAEPIAPLAGAPDAELSTVEPTEPTALGPLPAASKSPSTVGRLLASLGRRLARLGG